MPVCFNVQIKLLYNVTNFIDSLLKKKNMVEKDQLKHALREESGTLCNILEHSIPFGVVYHHSGEYQPFVQA